MTQADKPAAIQTSTRIAGLLVLAVGVCCGSWLLWRLGWSDGASAASVMQGIAAAGIWGVALSIGLMILHSFVPFPAEILAIANGMIYGPIGGTIVTWVGAMIGAVVAFWLARRLGRPFAARFVSADEFRRIDAWTERYGVGTFLVARLIPIIAFNLVNFAAGLTRLSLWTFIWTTGIGILPVTVAMVVVGDQIETLGLSREHWLSVLAAGVLLCAVVVRRHARGRPRVDE